MNLLSSFVLLSCSGLVDTINKINDFIAGKILVAGLLFAGLIFSSPWIPLIPDAIEFDWTALPINPKANTIAIAKNPAKI